MKTVNCIKCKHRDWVGLDFKCKKGHKPKYYFPTEEQIMRLDTNWGYKIKCEDYEEPNKRNKRTTLTKDEVKLVRQLLEERNELKKS